MSLLQTFLKSIAGFLIAKDANSLRNWLEVAPPISPGITNLIAELKQSWQNTGELVKLIDKLLPVIEDESPGDGCTWSHFRTFMKEYLVYWRDADFGDLILTHQKLAELAEDCIRSYSHDNHGGIMLPTTGAICKVLANLTTMLLTRPDLKRQLRIVVDSNTGETVSMPERMASVMQKALIASLARTANISGLKNGKPDGKKVGIYMFANMQLKLLLQSRKIKSSNQVFTSITQSSPQLGLYPASQRVTYLYFLGRYHFSNTHYYYARAALQSAYAQCRAQDYKQRRLILIYLMSCNMILGRFPTAAFLSRPEAADLLPRFVPIANAIKKGNMVEFKRALGPESGNDEWFMYYGVYLALLSRCEVLVWRTFARRVFLLTFEGIALNSAGQLRAPVLDLGNLVIAAQYCQKLLEGCTKSTQTGYLESSKDGPKKLGPYGGMIFRNKMPQLDDIEAILASLISQGLLGGFLSHEHGKFAIVGSKSKGGPLLAGFPEVWAVLKAKAAREGRDRECPGWVERERNTGGAQVYNFSGLKSVGDSG